MSDPSALHVEVMYDGKTKIGELETFEGAHIQRIQVDQRLDSPDFFTVDYQSTEQGEDKLLDLMAVGKEIEIKLGYGKAETLFKGEVSYIEPHFGGGNQTIAISGYDFSHRLTRGTSSRTFGDGHAEDQSPANAADTVVGDSQARKGGSSDGLASASGVADSKLEYIAQYNQNDYSFVQQIVGSFGMGWDSGSHANPKQVSLKALEKGSPVLTIIREKFTGDAEGEQAQAISADFRMSTVRQVARVEVRGWDFVNKKPINGFVESISSPIGGDPGHEQAGKAHYGSASSGRVVTVVDLPVRSEAEAKEIAQSIMDKFGMDWMTADVVTEGRPKVHAGAVVKVEDFGKAYSGEYYVEGCQHVWSASGSTPYRTYLKLSRNASPT